MTQIVELEHLFPSHDIIEGNEGKGATQKAQKGDMSGLVGNISVGLAPIQNFLTPTRMTLRFECVRRIVLFPFLELD